MRRVLLSIDRVSTFIGQLFAWLIVALAGLITWEVISRKFFDSPHAWMFDAQIQMYGVMFMMAGAYTLAKNGHVRGDVLYGFFPARLQATIDLVLFVVFFLPGTIAMVWAGWRFADESWAIGERSSVMSNGPPIYWFKTFIPMAGGLLLLQGIVEIIRCVQCLKDGVWPSRKEDVVEVDVEKLKELVHVTDAEIAAADRAIVAESQHAHVEEKPEEHRRERRGDEP